MTRTALDFYLTFIQEVKKCSRCDTVLETMEQVQEHCKNQSCGDQGQETL